MNKVTFILKAKSQYNIQSPFLFDLYQNVIAPQMDRSLLSASGIDARDRYAQLLYKLCDHYQAVETEKGDWLVDNLMRNADGSFIGVLRSPHRDKLQESVWKRTVDDPRVTLSVDLYNCGIIFTSRKLSKQHWLLRSPLNSKL
ncbi:MAG: hypothetical protein K5842_08560 [Bacteroidales bacterium]|nr:hypothetical protein [Bacteroidales bacterium]